MKLNIPDPHKLPRSGSTRRPARRSVPTKVSPTYRRPLETGVKGDRREDPLVIGEPNDAPAIFVEADGMRVEAVRKGDQRWVTGDGVIPAVEAGWFAVIVEDDWEESQ